VILEKTPRVTRFANNFDEPPAEALPEEEMADVEADAEAEEGDEGDEVRWTGQAEVNCVRAVMLLSETWSTGGRAGCRCAVGHRGRTAID